MLQEIQALKSNNTWTLVPPPNDQYVVGSKWVYKIKRKADGSVDRYKSRLVAKGYHQEEGIDYFETFSLMVRPTIIQVVLTISITYGWTMRQLDVHNVFLHGNLHDMIYMQ
jgi:Reverse transcriptase (RNA-dependent DNA polymerase)